MIELIVGFAIAIVFADYIVAVVGTLAALVLLGLIVAAVATFPGFAVPLLVGYGLILLAGKRD